MKEIFNEVLSAAQDSSDACLATVVATEGTAPRKEGSKMLVIGGKTLKGTVTIGGCVDSQVIEASEEVARSGSPQLLRMQLGEEDALEIDFWSIRRRKYRGRRKGKKIGVWVSLGDRDTMPIGKSLCIKFIRSTTIPDDSIKALFNCVWE